ncbi:MAG TPA: 2,3-diaminopropionate biosynthesis protein SbnB [Blastocatellia bacterium]|nr:2,3-diaminopropionate biosynthesis protein SbnB [Blastocatellia bacterium]
MSDLNENGGVLILRGEEIVSLLTGRESELMERAQTAYETHARQASSLPHSSFLTFPEQPRNRIIALPAYLGAGFEIAGMKWVSSFPQNLESGMDRASAVMILNSARTGRPQAVLEGSIISAKRTAASAVLAAKHLVSREVDGVGMIGCGLINFEIARFLLTQFPSLKTFHLYDRSPADAARFAEKCRALSGRVDVVLRENAESALESSPLISFATTATEPFIDSLDACRPGGVILHISLRDLTPQVILKCINVVDDADHVCRARTSVHLAEQLVGHRDFIKCALADITSGAAPWPENREQITVFSPFGLGVLDLAVGKYVYELARDRNIGTMIENFLPPRWSRRV